MLNGKHGQAKILTLKEINLLLEVGFISARDQALFMLCFYTACRISEARQIRIKNVFYKNAVLEEIVIPKEITKGKQATRTIPTHPSLAKFLSNYYQKSLELLTLKQTNGDWSHWSMNEDRKLLVHEDRKCSCCGSNRIIKCGIYACKKEQYYLCKACKRYFRKPKTIQESVIESSITIKDTLGVIASSSYGLLFENPDNPFLFPGLGGKGCLSLSRAGDIFEGAFAKVGIVGAASHSCRRTALTTMHSAGVPLRVLQEISGHRDLGALQRYLEVTEEEVLAAISLLS